MPEMPEVATVAKLINQDLQNEIILQAKILVPKMVKELSVSEFETALINKKVKRVFNIGKYLIFDLSQNLIMISHLRMEGRYRFSNKLNLTKHDHAWFKTKNGYLIFKDTRKFGTFNLRSSKNFLTTKPINKLGFLPIDLEGEQLFYFLRRKNLAIKSTLLDQSIIIGLGNIYVDEVLWSCKIHPQTKSNEITLEQANWIVDYTRKILATATSAGGSTIKTYVAYNKILGTYQEQLKVHTRMGKNCPRCQNKIIKIKVNGRGTYLCPKCQPLFL